MLQFNAQFVNTKLIPTLNEVLTDMTSPEATKGSYLRGLLYREPITNYMRTYFKRDYFELTQPVNRPFLEEGEEKYQDQLLDSIADYLNTKVTLTGSPERVRATLIPTDEKKYGENDQLTRQMRLFAYWLVRKFEQNTATDLINNSDAANATLQNGQVKVVYIDGKAVALTEEELKTNAANQLVPLVQPGLFEAITSGNAPDQSTEAYSKNELLGDFNKNESEAMKDALEAAGLEVIQIGTKDSNGIITAQVEDVNHQQLSVKIDTNLTNDSSAKFEFTFVNDPVHKEKFFLSQNDLRKKFMDGDERKPASQVAAEIATPEHEGPSEKITKANPEVPNAIPTIPGRTAMPNTAPGAAGAPAQDHFNIPSPTSITVPGTPNYPQGQQGRGQNLTGRSRITAGDKERAYFEETRKKFKPIRPKAGVQGKKTSGEGGKPQTQREAKQQTTQKQRVNSAAAPQKTKTGQKKGGAMGKIIAAAAGATAAAGPAMAAASYLIGGNGEQTAKTAQLILHCFGISCAA